MKTKQSNLIPILTIIGIIVILWYGFAVWMNAPFEYDKAARSGTEVSFMEVAKNTMNQKRPVLPTAHQVFEEIWKTTVQKKITSKRSLVYHGWITLSVTLLGFLQGAILGIFISVLIVHDKAIDKSLMPWIITSQTIPILAIAPMIIVVLNAFGFSGLIPKAFISTYLSFFPIVVGMVKGLRSPERAQFELLHTYNASRKQIFFKLRWPASMPYLFTSLKIGVAASLVGAIVAELPTGAVAGLGARMLAGSYYGQTVQIWSALFVAAIIAAALVIVLNILQKVVMVRMGQKPENARGDD